MKTYFLLSLASDEKLAKWSQHGNKRALNILLSRYLSKLRPMLHSYLHNYADEQDVLQNISMEAMRLLFHHQYKEMHNFFGWLRTIAYHKVMNLLRERAKSLKRFDRSELAMEALESDVTAEHNVVQEESNAWAKAALEMVPGRKGDFLRLRYLENRSIKKIAELRHCKENVVRMRLSRGIKWLKKHGPK